MTARRTIRIALILLLPSLIVLAACSTTETLEAQPAPAGFPLRVTDMFGRLVEVPRPPTRIVSISPTATEMLYLVGGTVVGRDISSKYPPEVQSLPGVGSSYSPSVEAIVALEPDMILAEVLTQGRLLETLEQTGAAVLGVRAASLEDVIHCLTVLGTITDRGETATQVIAEMQTRIDEAAASVKIPRKVLILISDADRNIYAAKPTSYAGGVAELLKLSNLAEGMPDTGPYPGFTLFSAEAAVNSNPDVIFAISPAPEPAPRLSEVLPRVPGYADLPAVREGRLKELNPELFLTAPGARIADAAEELLRLLNETFD